MNAALLVGNYDRIADAPDAIARLRRFILDLAVRGKLVEEDPNDEPSSKLLERIAAEKERLVKSGELQRSKSLSPRMVEAPFVLPSSWSWASVGSIFNYDAGKKVEPKALVPAAWLLELEDIEKETGRLLDRVAVQNRATQSTKSEFREGDVLYGKLRPYLNKVLVADGPGYSTTEIVAIRPYVSMCAEYCAIAFRRPDFLDYVSRLGKGTKMPRLRTEDAMVAAFPLPPVAEQHRIAAKVDELMALCDQLEAARSEREASRDRLAAANFARLSAARPETFFDDASIALQNLLPLTTRTDQIKQLRQTILNLAVRGKLTNQDEGNEPAVAQLQRISEEREQLIKMKLLRRERPLKAVQDNEVPFEAPAGWQWARIGDVALFTQYGTSAKAQSSERGVPVLTMGNIQDGSVVLRDDKRIPENSDELPDLYLQTFDLLYNRTNSAELVGKTGLYLGEGHCRTFASYLIRIRCSLEHSSPTYVNLAMNAPIFRATQIEPLIKQQTGQANVNGTALKNMLIPVPPLAEQHRIVAKVDELMAICDQLAGSLFDQSTTRSKLLDAVLHRSLEPAW